MKKAASLLIALLMIISVALSAPTAAYAFESENAINTTESNENSEEESLFMRIIHTIFFSKLTFDSNGGSSVPSQYAFKFFGKFKTPAEPKKEGYTFAGWEPEIPSRAPFGNVNVKAKWETNVYTIKWIVDETTYSSTELPYGVGIALPLEPVKEGYTFTGWTPAVAESMPAKDLVYTAQFTINSYKVTLKANDGQFADGKATKEFTVNYNSAFNCEEPSREGYVFGGWEEIVPETMPAKDVVLNATWVAKNDTTYTVEIYTMNTNGAYGSPQTRVFAGETDAQVSFTPNFGTGFYLDGQSVLTGTVKSDGSTVLKAYYARYQYLIKLDPNNGETVTQTYYYYGATIVASEPRKEGYNFNGWEPTISTVSKDETYTAQWKRATEYVQAANSEEFYDACSDLLNQSLNDNDFNSSEALNDPYYMGRVIISCSDYSVICFDDFEAAEIVFGDDGTVVLQFDNRDQAEEAAQALSEMSAVDFAEADAFIETPEDVEIEEIPDMEGSTWGEKYLNADKYAFYLENNNMNESITVAVIDSGVDLDHPYLSGRISSGGWNVMENNAIPEDDTGHGTHVAGIIKGCTNNLNVKILPIKALDSTGGSLLSIVNGITYAANQKVAVINLSLESRHNIYSKYVENAIEYAISRGCVVVAAAGNGDSVNHVPQDTANVCPANMSDAIVVGALDSNGNKGDFSNYGDSVDVIAPGVDIISSYIGGIYAKMDGTSQAAPHISAVAAMFKLSHSTYTPEQIEALVKQYCVDKGPLGRDEYYGDGCPDMYEAIPDCTVSFDTDGGSAVAETTTKNSSSIVLPKPTKSYKVSFDANGGTITSDYYTSECSFDGWFTTSSFNDERHPDGESYMLLKDQTLYAKWMNKYFDSTKAPTASRSNYQFVGWYTEANSGTKLDGSYEITDNIIAYAHWKQYTITFNANGGSGGPTTYTGYGTVKLPSIAPTRSKYDFLGWSESPSATTASYSKGGNISLTSNKTLYAVWKLSNVTVPNLNGMSYTNAVNTLSGLGLNYSYNAAYNYNVAANTVYSQSPAAGSSVAPGSTVTFTYSRGAKPFAVGDYVIFVGGPTYGTVGGTATNRDQSEVYITDSAYYYNGSNYYGICYVKGGSRICWVSESLLLQRTN